MNLVALSSFVDQILATLREEGDLTTGQLAARLVVWESIRYGPLTEHVTRHATIDDVLPVLKRMAWYGLVTGCIVTVLDAQAPTTVIWHREHGSATTMTTPFEDGGVTDAPVE